MMEQMLESLIKITMSGNENLVMEIESLRKEMYISNKLAILKELHALGQIDDENYIKQLNSALTVIGKA